MVSELKKVGINATIILDAAAGAIMEKMDFVLLGAEGVVENGGIINKIGSSTICLCAKMSNKPVYVAVESFKFVRFYPLNNRDIPDEFKVRERASERDCASPTLILQLSSLSSTNTPL